METFSHIFGCTISSKEESLFGTPSVPGHPIYYYKVK